MDGMNRIFSRNLSLKSRIVRQPAPTDYRNHRTACSLGRSGLFFG